MMSGLPSMVGRELREPRGLGRIEVQRLHPIHVERQARAVGVVDAHDVGPGNREVRLSVRHRLNGGLGFRRWRRAVPPALVGQEGEGHAEDVDVFRLEQARLRGSRRRTWRGARPRPTTCSHRSWLVKARRPMMWVTVLASQPSVNIPTEITF